MTKKINFKIQNYFNKFITKHEPPNTKQLISSSFLDKIECFFVTLEVLNGRLKILF
jgi:cytochrome c oxidase assembly protein Cox11